MTVACTPAHEPRGRLHAYGQGPPDPVTLFSLHPYSASGPRTFVEAMMTMTKNAAAKAAIRTRQRATGETYLQARAALEAEKVAAVWARRWNDALKQGEKPPHHQAWLDRAHTYAEMTVEESSFLIGQGLTPAQYTNRAMENRLSTTMLAYPVVVAPLVLNGRVHPQGFTVVRFVGRPPTSPGELDVSTDTAVALRIVQHQWAKACAAIGWGLHGDGGGRRRPDLVGVQPVTVVDGVTCWMLTMDVADDRTMAVDLHEWQDKLAAALGVPLVAFGASPDEEGRMNAFVGDLPAHMRV